MRHGTLTMATTGGCNEPCCAPIAARYARFYRSLRRRGVDLTVEVYPSLRKVRALQRLGHTRASIAREAGMTPQALSNALGRSLIRSRTAAKIDRAYRKLEMVVPPDNRWTRRTRAEAAHFLPPLAYDDIETGQIACDTASDLTIDEAVVQRILDGDGSLRATPAERAEVIRRWVALGRTRASLSALTGWSDSH